MGAFTHACERPLCFPFAESKTAQRPERLRVRRGRFRIQLGAVALAVGVPKSQPRRYTTLD